MASQLSIQFHNTSALWICPPLLASYRQCSGWQLSTWARLVERMICCGFTHNILLFFVSILLIPEQLLEPFFFLLKVFIFFSSSSMLFTCPDQSNQRKLQDAWFIQFDFLPKGRLFLEALKWCYTGFLKYFLHKMKKPVLPSSKCCLKSDCSYPYISGKHKPLHWIDHTGLTASVWCHPPASPTSVQSSGDKK